jgi:hypothetical protein
VAFAASFSAEKSDGEDNGLAKNWGMEISAALGFAPGTMSQVDRIAAGFTSAVLSTVQNVGQMAQKQKLGSGVLEGAADLAKVMNAGLQNQLTEGLGQLWRVEGSKLDNRVGDSTTEVQSAAGLATSSSLQAAVIFGMSGGKGVFRIELRDTKSMSINIGGGTNIGATIQAERSKRLLALGAERDADGRMRPALEVTGLRPLGRT